MVGLIAIAKKFVWYLVDPLERKLSYILYEYHHKNIFEVFEYYEDMLRNLRYMLQLSNYDEFNKWFVILDYFNKIIIKVNELRGMMTEEEKVGHRPRYRLGRKAMHVTQDMKRLLDQFKSEWYFMQFHYASASANPLGMLATKELIDALNDDEIIIVGVFGENSARIKSELIKVCQILHNESVFTDNELRSFRDIAIVVSKGQEAQAYLSKIQDDLAAMLGLTFKQTASFSERAKLLSETISRRDRILIILDNVSQKLDLKSVGIPCIKLDRYIKYKVVITSQEQRVCDEMGAQDFVHIEDFSDVGWGIFTKKTGTWVQNAGARSIAKSLVDKCGDKITDVEKLAKDVEAWVEKTKGPQTQTTQNEHRIGINRRSKNVPHSIS